MPTVATEPAYGKRYQAATEPVDPIHDYQIPILPFRQPPTFQDFPRIRKRKPPQERERNEEPAPKNQDGHIDDFA